MHAAKMSGVPQNALFGMSLLLQPHVIEREGSRLGLAEERQGWTFSRDGCKVSAPHPQGPSAGSPY